MLTRRSLCAAAGSAFAVTSRAHAADPPAPELIEVARSPRFIWNAVALTRAGLGSKVGFAAPSRRHVLRAGARSHPAHAGNARSRWHIRPQTWPVAKGVTLARHVAEVQQLMYPEPPGRLWVARCSATTTMMPVWQRTERRLSAKQR
jgi:hypothetical protein